MGGGYQSIALTTEPDGVLKGYSRALRLWLCWQNGMLKFYNDRTGEYLQNLAEERVARHQAEAKVRQLEEELGRRQRENS